jgi:hypothetical protein
MNASARATSVLLAFALASCGTTKLALVDSSYGYEHIDQQRALHLASARAVVAAEASAAASAGAPSAYQFFLDLSATNGSDSPWEVMAAEFQFEVMPCGQDVCTIATVAIGTTSAQLIAVPPRSTASLRVPVVIRTTAENLRPLERFPIELRYVRGDRVLLHQRLLIGEFDQFWQGVRFVGVLSGALLLVFLL